VSLSSRINKLETSIQDNTPPPATPVLIPQSDQEEAAIAERYQGKPHVVIATVCSRKCVDDCPDLGMYGCSKI